MGMGMAMTVGMTVRMAVAVVPRFAVMMVMCAQISPFRRQRCTNAAVQQESSRV